MARRMACRKRRPTPPGLIAAFEKKYGPIADYHPKKLTVKELLASGETIDPTVRAALQRLADRD